MSAQTIRILVVDDDRDVANSLTLLLSMEGYESRSVYEAQQAASEVEAFRPDVVLLDIGLPGMDGYEVARQIRARDGHQPVLVAVSGYGREEDRRLSEQAGFDAHFVKPMELGELERLLDAHGLK